MRRIERDLHDGTQARLVAMGMTLGAAEQLVDTDPAAAKALHRQGQGGVRGGARPSCAGWSAASTRRCWPSAASATRCARSPSTARSRSPSRWTCRDRPEPPVEAAAYFAVSELLTNAARHGGAREVTVDISRRGGDLRITVTDDGVGRRRPRAGQRPARASSAGWRRSTGCSRCNSPPGGPTVTVIELPGVLPVLRPAPGPSCRAGRSCRWWSCMGFSWLPAVPAGPGRARHQARRRRTRRPGSSRSTCPTPGSGWRSSRSSSPRPDHATSTASCPAVEYEHSERLGDPRPPMVRAVTSRARRRPATCCGRAWSTCCRRTASRSWRPWRPAPSCSRRCRAAPGRLDRGRTAAAHVHRRGPAGGAGSARKRVPGLPVLVLSQHVEQLYARELLADGSGGDRLPAQGPGLQRRAVRRRGAPGRRGRHRDGPGGDRQAARRQRPRRAARPRSPRGSGRCSRSWPRAAPTPRSASSST